MHKLRKKIGPEYLLEKLICHKDIHNYETRHNSDFVIPKASTKKSQNKFLNKCVKSYNGILKEKNSENKLIFSEKDSINTFKKKVKKHMLKN